MKRRRGPLVVCLAGLVAVGSTVAENWSLPQSAQSEWIEASIRALERNGVAERVSREFGIERPDGTRTLPVKHVVACETEPACVRVARWARRAGLSPSEVVTTYGHGGIAHFEIHLRQRVPLVSRRLAAEATRIHRALEKHAGTRYETWMLDVDPEGTAIGR